MNDKLHAELARAVTAHILWREHLCMCGQPWSPLHVADALMSIVERHVAQARAETAEWPHPESPLAKGEAYWRDAMTPEPEPKSGAECQREHDEFLEELDRAFGLEDGEESEYSNPEGAAEAIYIDVAAAYKREIDHGRALIAQARADELRAAADAMTREKGVTFADALMVRWLNDRAEDIARQHVGGRWAAMSEPIRSHHCCDKPFWRTPDSRWTCPDCGQTYAWTQTTRTVPGVPAAVCTVYENTWEPVEVASDDG